MMRWIIQSSLKYRFIVIALGIFMMIFGAMQIREAPIDAFPEFAPPRVEIQTEAFGLTTVETEEILTVPLEQVLAGTPGLDVLRSKTVPGLSSILLIFNPGTDIWLARQLVQERLATAVPDLPSAVAVPLMLPPLSSTSRSMFVGISSETISLNDMSTIAFWKIRPRLLGVPGVANVAIWGERLQQTHVQVDPDLLHEHGVSLNEVMEVTADALAVGILPYANSSVPGTGGWIETPNQRLGIQHTLPIAYPIDLAQVTVNDRVKSDGTPLLLSDLGQVVEDHPPLIGDAVINDGLGLLLIVEKFPWGNTLDVTKGVEEALDEIRPGLPGMELDSTIFRPATFIEFSIENLAQALLIGALLVALILAIFIFDWRVGLISIVAIPLSLTAAGIVLYQLGATINVMILAGFVIAIGAVVDDAIIDVENITRRLKLHRAEGGTRPVLRVILDASLEVRGAIVFATLIEVAAITPVFFMVGLSGAFFKPLALAYTLAILASMLVALTITPAMSLILLRNSRLDKRQSPLIPFLQRGYAKILRRIIRAPRTVFASVAVIVIAGVVIWPQLGQELLPSFKERDFLMHWLTKPGTSRPEMVRITQQASKELRAIPGVRNFGAHLGRALASDEVVGIYFTENWISIDPSVDYDETLAAVQEVVDGYPGLFRDVQTYLRERTREVLTGTSDAIVVRIFGEDLEVLRKTASELNSNLSEIDGLVDLHTELQVEVPQIEVEVDLEVAQFFGIKPGDVRRAAAALMASIEVGDIYRDSKAFDVAIWSTPEKRNSLTSLQNLPIDTPIGEQVLLGDVANISIVPSPNVIQHENTFRRIQVEANAKGRDLGSVTRDVERVLEEMELPLGYHAVLLGEYTERQAAQNRLFMTGIVAGIAIFLLLLASFRSWKLSLLAFVTLPSALVGGVLAAYIGGGVITLGSLVGFFTVLGISARNGIMLINHYQHLEQYEGEVMGPELVMRGARERLAPILMTALTTGLALVPLVISGNIPGHEIEHPMAIVILGGLVTSTLLNLFILPPLYLRLRTGGFRPSRIRASAVPQSS